MRPSPQTTRSNAASKVASGDTVAVTDPVAVAVYW